MVVNAIGIVTKAGRYGGTFAHSDIANIYNYIKSFVMDDESKINEL